MAHVKIIPAPPPQEKTLFRDIPEGSLIQYNRSDEIVKLVTSAGGTIDLDDGLGAVSRHADSMFYVLPRGTQVVLTQT